jgi:hypothetical protein
MEPYDVTVSRKQTPGHRAATLRDLRNLPIKRSVRFAG